MNHSRNVRLQPELPKNHRATGWLDSVSNRNFTARGVEQGWRGFFLE
jgi:hypothetical protein